MSSLLPTTAAQIITAINTTAVAGDTITIPKGTFDCSAATLAPPAGVTVTGGGKGETTITGAWWADLNGSPLPLVLRGMTLSCNGIAPIGTNTYGAMEFNDGIIIMSDVEISGAATTGNNLTFAARNYPVRAWMIRCDSHNAEADCISTKSPGSAATGDATLGANCLLTLVDCTAYEPGSGATDQALTTHEGFTVRAYGGTYTNDNAGSAIYPDAATSRIEVYGATINHTASNTTSVGAAILAGCKILTTASKKATATEEIRDCYVSGTLLAGFEAGTSGLKYLYNDIHDGGGIEHNSASCQIVGNRVRDRSGATLSGIKLNTAANGTIIIRHNLVTGCYRNYDFRCNASPTIHWEGNIAAAPGDDDVIEADGGGTPTITGGLNQFSGSTGGGEINGYTPLATDVQSTALTTAMLNDHAAMIRQRGDYAAVLSAARAEAEGALAAAIASNSAAGVMGENLDSTGTDTVTARKALEILTAVAAGKTAFNAETGVLQVYGRDNTTAILTITLSGDGVRAAKGTLV